MDPSDPPDLVIHTVRMCMVYRECAAMSKQMKHKQTCSEDQVVADPPVLIQLDVKWTFLIEIVFF